jgi:hypothetical protein
MMEDNEYQNGTLSDDCSSPPSNYKLPDPFITFLFSYVTTIKGKRLHPASLTEQKPVCAWLITISSAAISAN